MTAIALSLDRRVEDAVLPELVAAGHEVTARVQTAGELARVLTESDTRIALTGGSSARLTAELVRAADAAGGRLIVLAAGELERRHAASLGLLEVYDVTSDWQTIEQALLTPRSAPFRPAAASTPAAGRIIAVWGPTGAPGRTSIAMTVAAELAAAGRSVVLADADCYGGAIAPALGLLDEAPGFAAACRLAGADALTATELDRVAQRYMSTSKAGFAVLTGIGASSRWPELTADRVTTTLTECARWVDDVVVDTGFCLESDEEISSDLFAPRRNGATLAALRAADEVIAVGLADPVGLSRLLRGYAELAEAVPEARPRVVVNRVRASAVGFDPFGQVATTLARFGGIEASALVPDDPVAFDAALLAGRTLHDVAPRSRARAVLARFVEAAFVPQRQEATRARPRRRSRRLALVD